MISTYQQLLQEAALTHKQLSRKAQMIGFLRLIVALVLLGAIYFAFSAQGWIIDLVILLLLVLFLYLVSLHKKTNLLRQIAQAKIILNEKEIAFLKKK